METQRGSVLSLACQRLNSGLNIRSNLIYISSIAALQHGHFAPCRVNVENILGKETSDPSR